MTDRFDVLGPLPSGTTVLEASAGTGKTYAIAALATRYLAEGVPLESIMIVTFSRAATGELRVRVRSRLVETERALTAMINTGALPSGTDPLITLLATGSEDDVRLRRDRIAAALTDFDDATIATTHEFCGRMLDGLGMLARAEPDRQLVETIADLVDEVAVDTYLRRHATAQPQVLDPTTAHELARAAADNAQCRIVPDVDVADPKVRARVQFAVETRAETERRKRQQRLSTHDDVLVALRDSLADVDHGDAAVGLLRERFQVVLVDEFQDTDPVQWEIVRRAFGGHATVVLIGDPKQAIYGFRGADVHAYLDAVAAADHHATLGTNWRSDGSLVAAIDHLFAGAALGEDKIKVLPVQAHHDTGRLHDAGGAVAVPLRIRMIPTSPTATDPPPIRRSRTMINNDLVNQVIDLLESGMTVDDGDGARALQPRDIAVLVQKNATAETLAEALTTAGVPAVQTGATTVLDSEMADHWLAVLRALVEHRAGNVRRAALTPMIGWDFTRLATATEDELAELSLTLREWAAVAGSRGIAALQELMIDGHQVPARLLARTDGERLISDLRHVGELLHGRMTEQHLGLAALTDWLADSIIEARRGGADEQTRRLETDADAVQVLTVHRAKGLEFGVVLLPEAWERWVPDERGEVLRFHDPDTGELVIDVGGDTAPERSRRRAVWRDEEAGETLRLLYVGLTRARHQVITWWANSYNTPNSPLQRLLYGPRRAGAIPPPRVDVSGDPDTLAWLNADLISVERVDGRPRRRRQAEPSTSPSLSLSRFDRTLDQEWRRTSYSSLTAAAHDHPGATATASDDVGEDDERVVPVDEPLAPAASPPADDAPSGAPDALSPSSPSPMGELPAGTEFGTIMHAIFEHVDATADDLAAELRVMTAAELARTPYPVDGDALAAALVPAFQTPLGPLAGGLRLADIGPADRLSELDFELPLAGGDRPGPRIHLADVAGLLAGHLPSGHQLADYPRLLAADPTGDEPLRGFLTGSIDSVLRIPSDPRPPSDPRLPSLSRGSARHLVVDYKSNWLGEPGRELTLADYHPERLATAMMRAHYPLQALLYSVALHRFLRWRQPDYDPAVHLGGIAYLFVRGMAGPDTPTADGVPYGVFSWDPGPALVTDLSDLLDEGAPVTAAAATTRSEEAP
ncbi:UvrD-helicase domain-containing protein [Propionibacteriaceae bacterium Y2011]